MAVENYVYVHTRLDSKLPFYIGKGSTNRATSKKDRNAYWHHIVKKSGFSATIIQNDLTHKQALNGEKFAIAALKKFYKLANLTDGGDGGNGLSGENHPLYGKPRTEEVKKKLSDALKGRSFAHCASRKGITMSDEQKAKISASLKGKAKTPEHIKNASEASKLAKVLKRKAV